MMLEPHEIRLKMKDMNLSKISRNSGVAYMTIYRLWHNRPITVAALKKLSDYFTKREENETS